MTDPTKPKPAGRWELKITDDDGNIIEASVGPWQEMEIAPYVDGFIELPSILDADKEEPGDQ